MKLKNTFVAPMHPTFERSVLHINVTSLPEAAQVLRNCVRDGTPLGHERGQAFDTLRATVLPALIHANRPEVTDVKDALLDYICSGRVTAAHDAGPASQEVAKILLFDIHAASSTPAHELVAPLPSIPLLPTAAESLMVTGLHAHLKSQGLTPLTELRKDRKSQRIAARLSDYLAQAVEQFGVGDLVVQSKFKQPESTDYPLGFVSHSKEGDVIVSSFHSVRTKSGLYAACWEDKSCVFPTEADGASHQPTTLVGLRVQIAPAEIPKYLKGKPAGEKLESDVLYSPEAFELAQIALYNDPTCCTETPQAGALHGHLVRTIRGAVERQVPGLLASEGRTVPSTVEVSSIIPSTDSANRHRGPKLPGVYLVETSVGPCRVLLFIWFPESPQLSRRHGNESPYVIRCSSKLVPAKIARPPNNQ